MFHPQHPIPSLLRALRSAVLLLITLSFAGCTSIGMHNTAALQNINFGPQERLRICVLLDDHEVTEAEGVKLIQNIAQAFALYGIMVEVPWYRSWHQPDGGNSAIIQDLAARRLQAPCDRLIALAGVHVSDVLVGMLGVMTLGAVDTVTHTRGYVLCDSTCSGQMLTTPYIAIVHESYHLLGCEHDLSMENCYERIRMLKEAARQNRERGNDFFPTYSRNGQIILRREDVNLLESLALRIERVKRPKLETP